MRVASLSGAAVLRLLLVSLLAQLLGTLGYQLLAQALGIEVPFATMAWVRSAVVFFTMIPISISGFGLREGSLLVLLQPYGVAGKDVVALSLLVFGVTVFAVGIVGGWIEAARLVLRPKDAPTRPTDTKVT